MTQARVEVLAILTPTPPWLGSRSNSSGRAILNGFLDPVFPPAAHVLVTEKFMTRTMKRAPYLLSLALAAATYAQEVKRGSWEEVSALAMGAGVRVVRDDRSTVAGRVAMVSADAIGVNSKSGITSVPRAEVFKVSVKRRGSSRAQYAALGAVIGGGAGGAILGGYAAARQKPGAETGVPELLAMFGATVGAGLGAVIGFAASEHRTIYERRVQR